MKSIIFGTPDHIDHGKTSLVKALLARQCGPFFLARNAASFSS
jgi:translation elongation factor EF-Tu-like GTPase